MRRLKLGDLNLSRDDKGFLKELTQTDEKN